MITHHYILIRIVPEEWEEGTSHRILRVVINTYVKIHNALPLAWMLMWITIVIAAVVTREI
jgi:hypothetical protein